MAEPSIKDRTAPFRILSLDGGGAKGFYSLGVLREVEALLGARLSERFDLVFGTSTGAIIAALISIGKSIDEIHDLYCTHVPKIMALKRASECPPYRRQSIFHVSLAA